jgi:hypothetical protein
MNSLAIIGLSVLLCFIAFSAVAANYITPRVQAWSREDAIKALAAPHMFRFEGLAFLMPGVVSPFGAADLVLAIAFGITSSEGSPCSFFSARARKRCSTCPGRSFRLCWSRSG